MVLLVNRLKQYFPVRLEREESHPQKAAVLVILHQRQGKPHIVMIRRGQNLQRHAGETGFPGGVFEASDENLLTTALRETYEELGVMVDPALVVGTLSRVETRTGFQVHPFVAVCAAAPPFAPAEDEVDEVFDIPLIPLLATQQPDVGAAPELKQVVFWHRHYRIFGASARILREIATLWQ